MSAQFHLQLLQIENVISNNVLIIKKNPNTSKLEALWSSLQDLRSVYTVILSWLFFLLSHRHLKCPKRNVSFKKHPID